MNDRNLTIGRYEIQRLLGRGAMGVVYLAQDPGLKRSVAIKVVQSSGEDHEITLKRFRTEAEISAKLSHPNIVMVFDVGEDPAAGPFLAMEYVEGVSLTELIEKGLSTEEILALLVQGMSALQAAEAAHIVHRDIKPDNILVSMEGRFKLMDFGIARRDESRLTQAGMIFGTPTYTAPELLVGAEASSATDRYAFMVTAFEMLTGQVPYSGNSVANTLYRIVHDPPTFPEGLNSAMEEVFRKAFSKAPEARYSTLLEFMKALIAALEAPEDLKQRVLAHLDNETKSTRISIFPLPALDYVRDTAEKAPVKPGRSTVRRHWTATPALKWRWYRPWMLWASAGLLALISAGTTSAIFWSQGRGAQRVDIATTPAGANVLINGHYMGKTPLSHVKMQDRGAILRVELSGHQTVARTINPGEWSIHVVMVRPPFNIPVATEPTGAEVYLNGLLVGKTPMEALAVPREGMPELRIRRKGYQEWVAAVDENMPFPNPINLSPGGYGLRVVTHPPGADVFLDGALAGSTPVDYLELLGKKSHQLVLRLEGYRVWRESVTPGKALPDPIVLNPKS